MRSINLENERLRAIAVLMTVLVHAPFKQLLHPFFYSPFTGVDLFFVISGYVVSLSFLPTLSIQLADSALTRLENNKQAIIAFYLRRLFRIAPSAFFYIGLYWFVAIMMKSSGSIAAIAKPSDILREGFAFAGGIYNYALTAGAIPSNMAHYYSLTIEEHFYLLVPMLLVLCGRKSYQLAALCIGVFLVLFVARPITNGNIGLLSHTRFDQLLYGVIIALVVNKYRHLAVWQFNYHVGNQSDVENRFFSRLLQGERTRAVFKNLVAAFFCLLLTVLPGILNTDILGGGTGQFYFSSAAFCGYALVSVILVILASLERGWIFEIPVLAPILEYIGSRSYSLYLGHVLLIEVYNDLYFRFYEHVPKFLSLTRIGYILQFVIFLCVMFLLAEATYRLIENPFRKAGSKLIRSYKEATA